MINFDYLAAECFVYNFPERLNTWNSLIWYSINIYVNHIKGSYDTKGVT